MSDTFTLNGRPVAANGQPLPEPGFPGESGWEQEQRYDRVRARELEWFGKPQSERNQIASDVQFPSGARRFLVQIVPNPEARPKPPSAGQPAVEINANSEFEAEGRYKVLFGIRSVADTHLIQVTPVEHSDSATPAPPAAEGSDFVDADSEDVARKLGIETA